MSAVGSARPGSSMGSVCCSTVAVAVEDPGGVRRFVDAASSGSGGGTRRASRIDVSPGADVRTGRKTDKPSPSEPGSRFENAGAASFEPGGSWRPLRALAFVQQVAVLRDGPAERSDVYDSVDDVDDGGDGPYLAGAGNDARARNDPGRVYGPLEERPGQARLVHGVQVDDQVERFELLAYGVLLSIP
jgi:hypothetical protein